MIGSQRLNIHTRQPHTPKFHPSIILVPLISLLILLFIIPSVVAISPLTNGNFEYGNISEWSTTTQANTVCVNSYAYEGVYSARMYQAANLYRVINQVGITNVSFWAKIDTTMPEQWHQLDFYIKSGGTTQQSAYFMSGATGNVGWTYCEVNLTQWQSGWTIYFQTSPNWGACVYIDDVRINGVGAGDHFWNVTVKLHEYTGNYSTSPLIGGQISFNNTLYNVSSDGTTVINLLQGYYNILASSNGYDSASPGINTIDSDKTIELYLLKHNYTVVTYDIINSITHALVSSPNVYIHDMTTGDISYLNQPNGNFLAIENHVIWVNASKSGYTSVNQSYIFTGDTFIHLVMPSLQQPLYANDTFMTFRVMDSESWEYLQYAVVTLEGWMPFSTDRTGLITYEVEKDRNYNYSVTLSGYYPSTGNFNIDEPTYTDIYLVKISIMDNNTTYNIDNSFMGNYKRGWDDLFEGINQPIVDILNSAVNPLYDIHTGIEYIVGVEEDSVTAVSGYFEMFGMFVAPIVSGIPVKVQVVILYICLLSVLGTLWRHT